MNPLIQLKKATPVFLVALVCFGPLPTIQAVSPAPDGGYPGGNTAEGQNALFNLTTGGFNTAVGWFSLRSNTLGQFNTAVGAGTLLFNIGDPATITGIENTAVGAGALLSNTTGEQNTAIGAFALLNNTTGFINLATGDSALFSNTTGGGNTAIGSDALSGNTTGNQNTGTGLAALADNINGDDNTATGYHALLGISTGSNNNIALGFDAGSNLTSGSNNIYLGSLGVATESNTIRIGTSGVQTSAFIRGVRGVTTGNNDAIPVLIDTAGQLGTTSSSRRFKKEIKPMDKASELLLALKPVTFHYKSDNTSTPQFGLIAEEVAAINPDLVVRDENGEIYTVRYDAVNAMLLNEFLKEHRKLQEQEATIALQKSNDEKREATTAKQQKQIEALTAGLQKVSAQLELNKPAPQTVKNTH